MIDIDININIDNLNSTVCEIWFILPIRQQPRF